MIFNKIKKDELFIRILIKILNTQDNLHSKINLQLKSNIKLDRNHNFLIDYSLIYKIILKIKINN